MKGFKRQAQKQMAPQMQADMMVNFSEQVEDVYGALNEAVDSEGEEELEQAREQAMPRSAMMMESASMSMASAP